MKRSLPAFITSISALMLATALPAWADELDPTAKWSAFDKGDAAVPPMGWNSYNAFGLAVDEEKLMASAKILVSSGLAAKGFRYVNIDEGWWARRGADGRLVIRTDRFPSARTASGKTTFLPLTNRLHAMGLKAGIYSDIGRNTCGQQYSNDTASMPTGTQAEREVGLYGHVESDIALYFKSWGFDYIKVDGCGIRGLDAQNPKVKSGQFRALDPLIDNDSLGRTDIPKVRALFSEVRDALVKNNPDNDFIFSICIWGTADVRSWAKDVGNTSRTSEDISPTWNRMLFNLDTSSRRALYAHPGSWNDPDMLYIGTGEFDAEHQTEARSHFAMWAMLNAPLIIGYDLRKATPEQMALFGNSQIIALDQDPAGNQAVLAYDSDDLQIYVKTLADGTKAVAVLNRTSAPLNAELTAAHLKFSADGPISLTNLWTGEKTQFTGEDKLSLAPRQTLVFKASGSRVLTQGLYLSEMPGRINVAVDGVVVPQVEPISYRAILPWIGTHGTGEHPRYGGWGGAQADQTPYGEELAIAGQKFPTGIGILADSRMEIRNEGFAHFTADVGVDDSARDRSQPVTFLVYADGKLAAKSDPKRFGDAPSHLEADVGNAKIIEIVARTPQSVRFPDTVTWGNAALTH